MAQLYTAGERKPRPGVYYRYSNAGTESTGAMDGVNAIVINASWGPEETVTTHYDAESIEKTYGAGAGVKAAKMLIAGGAKKVFISRAKGKSAQKATATLGTVTIESKYPGKRDLKVKVQKKPGNESIKQLLVLEDTKRLELFEFDVHVSDESAGIKEACKNSEYITIKTATTGVVEEKEIQLTGGADGSLTAQEYLAGFKALEPYRYNVLTTDSTDENISLILKTYADQAEEDGKLTLGVVGVPSSVTYEERLSKAKEYNDKKIVFFGSGYIRPNGEVIDGANAINYTAGAISSTPSNQSIVHTTIDTAVDLTEKLTNEEYERAIANGLLLLSIGPDGQVWFDSGINTLTVLADNEDAGWKKIKRTKVRYELFDRIDRVVAPLIGKTNCDADGIAAVIQVGMGVINSMISEKKIQPGATMIEDPSNPPDVDSAWFVIQVDDIDTLEKIYLHYRFRNSAN